MFLYKQDRRFVQFHVLYGENHEAWPQTIASIDFYSIVTIKKEVNQYSSTFHPRRRFSGGCYPERT